MKTRNSSVVLCMALLRICVTGRGRGTRLGQGWVECVLWVMGEERLIRGRWAWLLRWVSTKEGVAKTEIGKMGVTAQYATKSLSFSFFITPHSSSFSSLNYSRSQNRRQRTRRHHHRLPHRKNPKNQHLRAFRYQFQCRRLISPKANWASTHSTLSSQPRILSRRWAISWTSCWRVCLRLGHFNTFADQVAELISQRRRWVNGSFFTVATFHFY